MPRPVHERTCSCGRVCASRSGLLTHGRACSVERARSAVVVAAIEAGLSRATTDLLMWETIDAARAGRPLPPLPARHTVTCSTCGRLSVAPTVSLGTAHHLADRHADAVDDEPGHEVAVEPAVEVPR